MGPTQPSGGHADDAAPLRARLRRERLAARLAMSGEDHARASARIAAALKSAMAARRPQTIGFCWPVRREFDARPWIAELIHAGWRACQPVVVAPAAPMQFRRWTPGAPMTADRHGIPVPDTAPCAAPDILLLPLVAFDGAGYRLGYGGGFFDRWLAAHAGVTAVGLAWSVGECRFAAEPHDQPLTLILTEHEILAP